MTFANIPNQALVDLLKARERLKVDIDAARERYGEGRELSIAKAALLAIDDVIKAARAA